MSGSVQAWSTGDMTPGPSDPPPAHPMIIQGGMGVAISDWRLAAAVTRTGQLGVVSGTALEVLMTRRLQEGDPGGHVRRALAAFPVPRIAEWIVSAYYSPRGRAPDELYRAVPRFNLAPSSRVVELTVAANFVEVFLARQAGGGPVGINYLRKIELPLPASLYGALLAGVDYMLVGAGNPADVPGLVRSLSRHQDVELPIRVQGARSSDGPYSIAFSPAAVLGFAPGTSTTPAPLRLPRVLAIVASNDLAKALADNPAFRPDGFVVEGPSAGGHNAPPRGPRRMDDRGQPVYDARDEPDIAGIVALGLPVWLAGSYGTCEGLRDALDLGAAGIQVGTVFAYCEESGFPPWIKEYVLAGAARGSLVTRSDWRVSPTGFPFRVVEIPGTLSDPQVVAERTPVCDLGMLRSAYLEPDGSVGYRCPSEPASSFLGRKGGREVAMSGRVCLCNALFASAGFPQCRRNGYLEPPLVTAGADLRGIQTMLARSCDGHYQAADVIRYLLGEDRAPGGAPYHRREGVMADVR
jgi:NAD(P)H-dependent flavin oxidoreductase YrpB (nitropropane dioxygenase family)